MKRVSVSLWALMPVLSVIAMGPGCDSAPAPDAHGGAAGSAGNARGGQPSGGRSSGNGGGRVAQGGANTAGGSSHGGSEHVEGRGGNTGGSSTLDRGGSGAVDAVGGGSGASGGTGSARGGTSNGGASSPGGFAGQGGVENAGAGGDAGASGAHTANAGGASAGSANGGEGGSGGAVELTPPGCLHSSYAIPVTFMFRLPPNCLLDRQYAGNAYVSIFHDATQGWLVDFPGSVSAGPYPLRETADGYEGGSTGPALPGTPLIGFHANCSTGMVRVSGVSGDCLGQSGSTQFSGERTECALWALFSGSGRAIQGTPVALHAYVTCRDQPSFEFVMHDPWGRTSVVQALSAESSFYWDTLHALLGDYTFDVRVHSADGVDETITLPYYLIPQP